MIWWKAIGIIVMCAVVALVALGFIALLWANLQSKASEASPLQEPEPVCDEHCRDQEYILDEMLNNTL